MLEEVEAVLELADGRFDVARAGLGEGKLEGEGEVLEGIGPLALQVGEHVLQQLVLPRDLLVEF